MDMANVHIMCGYNVLFNYGAVATSHDSQKQTGATPPTSSMEWREASLEWREASYFILPHSHIPLPYSSQSLLILSITSPTHLAHGGAAIKYHTPCVSWSDSGSRSLAAMASCKSPFTLSKQHISTSPLLTLANYTFNYGK